MNQTLIIALVIIVTVKILIFAWFYLFNIYEVKISVNPKLLNLNSDSQIEIKTIPLNSFGTKALLRNISAKFKIVSGEDLIKIKQQKENTIVVTSKGKVGSAEILVTPSIGMFPSKIEINIE
ncbi:MAG: hypothetical protein PF445_07765 [Melioribacteraceae bacterium]|jgi:hypothetical protein|nr:hypothetical protein [Melioribacteraceae bacterium]